jgi:hypothetical protein
LDVRENAVQIAKYVIISHANHAPPSRSQVAVPSFIVLSDNSPEVNASIDFHDQLCTDASKIRNARTDWVLTTKLVPKRNVGS